MMVHSSTLFMMWQYIAFDGACGVALLMQTAGGLLL
jgi:hypothetical protein